MNQDQLKFVWCSTGPKFEHLETNDFLLEQCLLFTIDIKSKKPIQKCCVCVQGNCNIFCPNQCPQLICNWSKFSEVIVRDLMYFYHHSVMFAFHAEPLEFPFGSAKIKDGVIDQ